MTETKKIMAFFMLGCLFVLIVRWIDLWVSGFLSSSMAFSFLSRNHAGFDDYRDFVTVVTGLLTLIVGAIGIGSYISFKAIKKEANKVAKRRKRLDMFLKIEEARYSSDPEWGYISAIKLYDEAEQAYSEDYLLYSLRGEAHFLAWKSGASPLGCRDKFHLIKAKEDFEKAIEMNRRAMSALYGLGRTIFEIALTSKKPNDETVLDWSIVDKLVKCDGHTSQFPLTPSDMPIEFKKNSDYLYVDKCEVEKSIQLMSHAVFNGYDEIKISFELGGMYEAMNSFENALKHYQKAYKNNYIAAGYSYAYLWIRTKDVNYFNKAKEGSDKKIEVDDVLRILNTVAEFDGNYSKAALALLVFVYAVTPGYSCDDVKNAFWRTDKITMEKLFKMQGS